MATAAVGPQYGSQELAQPLSANTGLTAGGLAGTAAVTVAPSHGVDGSSAGPG